MKSETKWTEDMKKAHREKMKQLYRGMRYHCLIISHIQCDKILQGAESDQGSAQVSEAYLHKVSNDEYFRKNK